MGVFAEAILLSFRRLSSSAEGEVAKTHLECPTWPSERLCNT
jgi:hypothetical protein